MTSSHDRSGDFPFSSLTCACPFLDLACRARKSRDSGSGCVRSDLYRYSGLSSAHGGLAVGESADETRRFADAECERERPARGEDCGVFRGGSEDLRGVETCLVVILADPVLLLLVAEGLLGDAEPRVAVLRGVTGLFLLLLPLPLTTGGLGAADAFLYCLRLSSEGVRVMDVDVSLIGRLSWAASAASSGWSGVLWAHRLRLSCRFGGLTAAPFA